MDKNLDRHYVISLLTISYCFRTLNQVLHNVWAPILLYMHFYFWVNSLIHLKILDIYMLFSGWQTYRTESLLSS